jgi:ParB family chromosome partitioning protein
MNPETRITVPYSQINISGRQRKILTEEDILSLAKSIQDYGLFNPVLVRKMDDNLYELIAGFTRLQALLSLGIEQIPITLSEEADEIVLKEMELEENIRRKDLEWWEKADAVAEIHEMRQARDPTWSMRKTAAMIGESAATVSQAVQLRNEVQANPEMKGEKTLRGALAKLDVKKKLVEKKADIERRSKGLLPSLRAEIVIGDAAELIKQEPDESFDAVITNLPFGVDLEFKSGHKPYEDEEQYIIDLVQTIVTESFRVLKNDSWFVAWFDVRKITYSNHQRKLYRMVENNDKLKKLAFDSMGLTFWLEEAGFSYVNVVPAFWVKPNKTQGMIGDPRKGMIVAAEAMIIASKGDAFLMKQGRNNVFIYDTLSSSERDYSMQMPVALCTEIVSMVALGGARILDPFAGSGSIGLGALHKQCEFKGYELNPEAAAIGRMLLKEHHLSQTEEEPEEDWSAVEEEE